MSRFTYLVLIFAWGSAGAAPQPWMVKDNPFELDYEISAGDCEDKAAGIQRELAEAIEASLVKARLKPKAGIFTDLGLEAHATCVTADAGYIYHLRLAWTIFACQARGNRFLSACNPVYPVYSYTGLGDRESIVRQMGPLVDRAVADYLQANPDLQKDR